MKIRTRLYVESKLSEGRNVDISSAQMHFLKNVIRVNVDDKILLFNGKDGEFLARVAEITNKFILLSCEEKIRELKSSPEIKLYFGSTNKHRLAFLVEKACELGVTALQPISTEYGNKSLFNVEKMKLQAIEACEQCGRIDIPDTLPIIKLKDLKDTNILLFADESKVGESLFNILPTLKDKAVSIIIGPAGGFSEDEKALLNSLPNVKNVSLGENILRVETAGIMILSCLRCV